MIGEHIATCELNILTSFWLISIRCPIVKLLQFHFYYTLQLACVMGTPPNYFDL